MVTAQFRVQRYNKKLKIENEKLKIKEKIGKNTPFRKIGTENAQMFAYLAKKQYFCTQIIIHYAGSSTTMQPRRSAH